MRDTNRWLSTVVIPSPCVSFSTSPSDSDLSFLSSSPSSSLSSVSSSDLSSDSDLEEVDSDKARQFNEENYDFPPSPPIFTAKSLKATNNASLVPSPASLDLADYFTSRASFLTSIFPKSKLLDNAVTVADPTNTWSLALCNEGSDKRTLYAKASGYETMNMRDNLVELLDRADVDLECDHLVVILDKKDAKLASMLHSLLYVGGIVIRSDSKSAHGKASSGHVLVGLEL